MRTRLAGTTFLHTQCRTGPQRCGSQLLYLAHLNRSRQLWQIHRDEPRRELINNLEAELDDARLEGAGDLTAVKIRCSRSDRR